MKDSWKDVIEEKVSPELKHKTMARARQELLGKQKRSFVLLLWLTPLVSAALGGLLWFISDKKESSIRPIADLDENFLDELSDLSPEEVMEFDEQVVADLDFYEDFDVLEVWDGEEES